MHKVNTYAAASVEESARIASRIKETFTEHRTNLDKLRPDLSVAERDQLFEELASSAKKFLATIANHVVHQRDQFTDVLTVVDTLQLQADRSLIRHGLHVNIHAVLGLELDVLHVVCEAYGALTRKDIVGPDLSSVVTTFIIFFLLNLFVLSPPENSIAR